jgi:myo-inositol-1(or 4)-monophosphatase
VSLIFVILQKIISMNYQQICSKTIEVAREAGAYMMTQQQTLRNDDIVTKGLHDFVTYVDKTSEKLIIDRLSLLLPGSTFLAEESADSSKQSDMMWIIDPLDGTTNFIHGLPMFSVSIALRHNDQLVVGVIYEPNLDECFYAWKDGGAWLNSKQIFVSETNKFAGSLMATGFPYYDYQHLDGFMELLKFSIKETRGLRRLGSAALDMAWVACGRFEAFYEYGLRPWDVAAGACIIEEAGGKVTDFQNGSSFFEKKEIIASNGKIHQQLYEKIQEYYFGTTES